MSIEAALYSILSGNAGVAALAGTRIYPVFLPLPDEAAAQALQPTVIYSLDSEEDEGQGLDAGQMWKAVFGVSAIARDYEACSNLSVAIRDALHGLETTTGGLVVAAMQTTRSDDESAVEDELFQKTHSFEISYRTA